MKRFAVLLFACVSTSAFADSPVLQKQLDETVKPFVGKYCVGCHSGAQPTAQLDLKSFATVDQVREDFGRWSLLAERLTAQGAQPRSA